VQRANYTFISFQVQRIQRDTRDGPFNFLSLPKATVRTVGPKRSGPVVKQ